MMKFPTPRGITTLVTRTAAVFECWRLEEKRTTQEEKVEEKEPDWMEDSVGEEVVVNPAFLEQKVTFKTQFSKECRLRLISLLNNNMDMFAWQPSDMTGVPKRIIRHTLNVNMSTPHMAQKRRVLGTEKNLAVMKEVKEWVKDACLKDYYPLPEIDLKIESVMGFRFKCFLDAYKRYHQIQMAEEDEEKATFYIDQGNYFYTKMPFRLKNVGATYQRLVDSAFQTQLGRNLEAYVDDMIQRIWGLHGNLGRMRLRRYFEAHPIKVITDQADTEQDRSL
ncbi:hypothetical protein Tco_0499095 [Tanacetum coccineum]